MNKEKHLADLQKKGFNETETIKSLGKGYNFTLSKDVIALGLDDDSFLKGDEIEIIEIRHHKKYNDQMDFSVKRGKNIKNQKMAV